MRALLPYSERHFQRLDRLLQSSYLVEHTLASMQMLVEESGAATAAVGENSALRGGQRPLVRELKRLRQERGKGEGDVEAGGDSSSSEDSSSEEGVVPIPESETVDGRVVFNVRLEPEDPGDGSSSDGGSDGGEDVAMGEVLPDNSRERLSQGGVYAAGDGGEEEAESSARAHKKKKRKGEKKSVALGLVGQPEAVAELAPVPKEGEKGEEVGGGKRKRKKRGKSLTPAETGEGSSSSAAAVVEAVEPTVVVEKIAEEVAEGGGSNKKKKKRSGKGRRRSSAV